MKDIVIEIWKMLPIKVRKLLLPFVIIVTLAVVIFNTFLYFITTKEPVSQIVILLPFQLLILLLILTLIYLLIRQSTLYSKASNFSQLVIILFITTIGISTLLWHRQKSDAITIYLYPIEEPMNYDWNKLRTYIHRINLYTDSNELPIKFDLHEVKYGILMHEDTFDLNGLRVIEILKQLNPSESQKKENNIIIGLVSIKLNDGNKIAEKRVSNIFSMASKNHYGAISTFGLEDKAYWQDDKPLDIHKYIINRSIKIMLYASGNNNPVMYDSHESYSGCLFNYMRQKDGIYNAVNEPYICKDHRAVITDHFGDKKYLEAADKVLKFESTN